MSVTGVSVERIAISVTFPKHPLAPGGTGILIATWSHSVRASRYLVFKQITGTDPAPVQVASDVDGLAFTLLGLPTGETAQVFIVPANPANDGPPSPTVSAVVP